MPERCREYVLATSCIAVLVFAAFVGAYSGRQQPFANAPKVQENQEPGSLASGQNLPDANQKRPNDTTPFNNSRVAEHLERHAEKISEKLPKEASEFYTLCGWRLKLTDSLIVVFTFFLVLVGVAQGIWLRYTMKATEKAANAAKQAAEIIPNLERAYVYVERIETGQVTTMSAVNMAYSYGFELKVKFRNFGRTPASLATLICLYDFLDHVPTDEDTERQTKGTQKLGNREEMVVIGSKKAWRSPPVDKTIVAQSSEGQKFEAQEISLYCWGRLEYRDIFGKINPTEFCRRYNLQLREWEIAAGFARNRTS